MNKAILHIEDEPVLVKLVATAFKSFGYNGEIIVAETLTEAKNVLRDRVELNLSLDLILMDIFFGEGSGLGLIDSIRNNDVTATLPVIVLSSQLDRKIIDASYALGANCYLPKGYKQRSMTEVIRSLYDCWLVDPVVLHKKPEVAEKDIFSRGRMFRSMTAEVFLRFAEKSVNDEMKKFWTDCAIRESNIASTNEFVRSAIGDRVLALPEDLVSLMTKSHNDLFKATRSALQMLDKAPPVGNDAFFSKALEFTELLDLETVDKIIKALPTESLNLYCAALETFVLQNRMICDGALELTTSQQLKERALRVIKKAESLTFADAGKLDLQVASDVSRN